MLTSLGFALFMSPSAAQPKPRICHFLGIAKTIQQVPTLTHIFINSRKQ